MNETTDHAARKATVTALPQGTWQLDAERTTVTVTVRALFGLLAVRGTLQLRAGAVRIPGIGGPVAVEAAVDPASYRSGNGTRDRDVTGPALLDAARHPRLTLTAATVTSAAGGATVPGDLEAHGVAVPVELQVTDIRIAGDEATFRVEGVLDRRAFGITAKGGMVGRRARLAIDAVATRCGSLPTAP